MKEILNSTKHLVERILTDVPETRNNDNLLIAHYFHTKYNTTDILKIAKFTSHNEFESVRRMRQKIQEHNPTLRGNELVKRKRAKAEEEYRDAIRDM